MTSENETILEKLNQLLVQQAESGQKPYIFSNEEVEKIKQSIEFTDDLVRDKVDADVIVKMTQLYVRLDGAFWVGSRLLAVVTLAGVVVANWERIGDFLGSFRK